MRGFQPFLLQRDDEPLSVSDLNAHVKALLDDDDVLADVRVRGEISNFKRHTSGHVYFSLKDGAASLKCVMWRTAAARLRTLPRDGDQAVARGRVSVFERDGAYQLYVESLVAAGVGDLYAQFEALKQRLAVEGLFDAARKRALPRFPRVLGVVTSPTGAALQDVLNVLKRRYPLIEVCLAPAQVQGAEAPASVVRALRALARQRGDLAPDVILVARGGGSAEDLWPFNDERLVRAIVASPVPVVTGVGHEIDVTLADFAADVRAPTPSAAAEVIAPDADDLRQQVDGAAQWLSQSAAGRLAEARERLSGLELALRALSPAGRMAGERARLADARARLGAAARGLLALRSARLDGLAGRLRAFDPQATLSRGYAIVTREDDGAVIRSVADAPTGATLRVRVADGAFGARAGSAHTPGAQAEPGAPI